MKSFLVAELLEIASDLIADYPDAASELAKRMSQAIKNEQYRENDERDNNGKRL